MSEYPGRLAAGSRVAGYRVEKLAGAGAMAEVYRARDERLGRPVALKVLDPALAADEEFRRRFTAESRAAAKVDDPHIIPVYEAGEADGVLFIAMRLVTGGDLRQVLAREGPMPPGRAAQFLSPAASALDAAHRAGLVHRDVKPANILVDAHPDRPEHVYLSDFGISKGATSTAGLTKTDQYLGTPAYTSPEQVRGQTVDGRADQYALACVAWHLLTGTVPFPRDQGTAVLLAHLIEPPPSLGERRPGLPAAAGSALARAMAKEPGERYPSCGEFTDALRDALGLPPYRPAVPAHPRTETSAPPAPPATVTITVPMAPADPAGARAMAEASPLAAGAPGKSAVASRGETHRLMGRHDEALADFSRAIELNPSDAGTILLRGVVYHSMGRHDEALADFSRAAELNPSYAMAIAWRGLVYYETGRHDQALADYGRAIELDPSLAWPFALRGVAYRDTGRHDDALADLDRSIELDPSSAWAIASRGLTYRVMGRHDEALADFSRAIELNPSDAWTIAQRGETHRLMSLEPPSSES